MKKFRFNPETLQYVSIHFPLWRRLIDLFPYILSVAFFSLLFLYILDKQLNSPKVKSLKSQQAQIDMKLNIMEAEVKRMEQILSGIQNNDDHIYRTYFEVSPLSASLRNAGFGGNAYTSTFNSSKYQSKLNNLNRELDKLSKKLVVQSKSFEDVVEMANSKEKRLAARPAIQPLSIKELTRFGSPFGMRIHPILKKKRMHEGIDLTAPRGTKIFATADGVVVEARWSSGGYGNKIVINHGYGYQTLYGHCHKLLVEKGQKVKRGDVIGIVGNTGLSVSPHLHYEVHVNGRAVNPIHYYANDLSADEFDKMIELLSTADPGFDIN
jgi:murein DD-endopeptidase MepM/ murein hydrolase activator NlpD